MIDMCTIRLLQRTQLDPGRGCCGWQAKAAHRVGVDLASVYRCVSRPERGGCAPHDAGPELTRDEITRAAQKGREKYARENSKWTRADLIANLGRVLPAGPPIRTATRGCWRR